MKNHVFYIVLLFNLLSKYISCVDHEFYDYLNRTDPSMRQLYEFSQQHPKPIGILTTGSGKLVEIRETIALNSDPFSNLYHVDITTHFNAERVPERFVHAKGTATFGYFEVTHDVSKYTKADVFNGVGKKTPLVARFSLAVSSRGGADSVRGMKGLAFKLYTKEGNLDLLCINFPAFFYRDPNEFQSFVHTFKANPKVGIISPTSHLDFITKRPDLIHGYLWAFSDYGIPNGYRKMDVFPVHTYVINNKKKERYFVRFNFRTEQGVENLSVEESIVMAGRDPDYYNRDLYNAIEQQNYPAWRLEMDIMTYEQVRNLDYNPFDVTRLWKKGTYKTVTIGRAVLNRNPDNSFAVAEQSAFNPGRLVPGIPGPIDVMFKARRQSYRDTQVYRMGVNHNKIEVNAPLYAKNYLRDGRAPVGENMRDAPNYYPNSFNGPIPFVDASQPKERMSVLESHAVDLEPASTFYNDYLDCSERERLANNTAQELVNVAPFIRKRVIRLYTLIDTDFGKRVTESLERLSRIPPPPPPEPLIPSYYIRKSGENKKNPYKTKASDVCYS